MAARDETSGLRWRLPRAREGAAAALPLRISRRWIVRRADAPAERGGLAIRGAEAARASRRVVDRAVDGVVRQALGNARRPWPRGAVRPLCAPRRSAGGASGGRSRRSVLPLDRRRLLHRRSGARQRDSALVPALRDPRPG